MSATPQSIIAVAPMSRLQITAVTMCVLINALDGFDVLSISFAAPGIAADWGINRATLGVVLAMELFGMGVGSILLGNLADKWGRRAVTLGCLVITSLGMLGAALAANLTELIICRLFTGLGIGGMLATTNALTAEFSNDRIRPTAIILMGGGYPLGVIIGGAISSYLLVFYDWRAVFYLGFAVTASFIVLVWFLLPESVNYLAQKRPANALQRINETLTRMKHPTIAALPEVAQQHKFGIAELFSPELRKQTVLLAVAYFAHIMTFYFILKWIPKLVVDMGFAASEAGGVLVWANVGGLLGCLVIGFLAQKYAVKILLLSVLIGSVIMIVVFGRGQSDLTQMALIAGIAGFFINSAITCLYALFAHVFPTNVRAGGTGFIIGIGRGGAALGPIIAGFMFSFGYMLQSVALLMALGSVIAFIAIVFLRPGQHST